MTVTNTSLLGLALPTTGTESGVWGDDVNNGLTILIDVSVAGTNNITQNSDITLAVSNGNNSSSFTSTATNSAVAQYYVLNCSGARTALRNIIVPTTSKTYVVTNGTTGGFGITVKKSGGTGVTVAAGETAIVFYNTVTGDVAKVTSTVNVSSFSAGTTGLTPNTATTGAVTLAGTLATTNGGTGLTSFTSSGVVYASSTSALATGSALTFDGTNFGVGVTPSAWIGSRKILAIGGATVAGLNFQSAVGESYYNCYYTSGATLTYQNTGYAGIVDFNNRNPGGFTWNIAASGTAGGTVTLTQAMTFDASGNLLVGTTTDPVSAKSGVVCGQGINSRAGYGSATTTANAINLYYNGTNVSLYVDTSNLGAITTVSDYRIKRNIATQTIPALDRVMALRPVTYQMADFKNGLFKAGDDIKEGFIAHEVQEVIPSGVDGVKDDENQIQSLRVDAILSVAVKAIQELSAQVTTLQTQVTALKG